LPEELAGDVGSECGFAPGYRLNDGDPWRGATRTAEQSPKRPRFRGSAARRRHRSTGCGTPPRRLSTALRSIARGRFDPWSWPAWFACSRAP